MFQMNKIKGSIPEIFGDKRIKYKRAPTEDWKETEGQSSNIKSKSVVCHNVTDFANIFKSFMGSAYLSNPFAYHQAGIGLGAVAMVLIAIATTHCCQLAVRCKKQIVRQLLQKQYPDHDQITDDNMNERMFKEITETRRNLERTLTLQDISRIALGKWGLRTVNMALFVTQFGFCTSYVIFLGKTLQHLFGSIGNDYDEEMNEDVRSLATESIPATKSILATNFANETNNTTYIYYTTNTDSVEMTTASLYLNQSITTAMVPPIFKSHAPSYAEFVLILYPIFIGYSLIRKMRNIGPISVVSNIINMCAYVAIMGYLTTNYSPRTDIVGSKWATFPIFFGMMTGAYEGLGTIIPIESSMEGNREYYPVLLYAAMSLYTCLMAGIGILGYLVYGEDVHQVIVWNLPHHTPLVRLVNISLLLNVLSTFPIQLFPAIETVEGLVFASNQSSTHHQTEVTIEMDDMSKKDMDVQIQQNGSDNGKKQHKQKQMAMSTNDVVNKAATWKRNIVRIMIVTIQVIIALIFEEEFAYFGAFIGSLGCSIISFILPCLIHLNITGIKSLSRAVVFKDIGLICVGVIGGVIGIYTSVAKIVRHMQESS